MYYPIFPFTLCTRYFQLLGNLSRLFETETIFTGKFLRQMDLLIPIIGRDHASLSKNYPMLNIDFIDITISLLWKIYPNHWQLKLYLWDQNQGSFICQSQCLGETIYSQGIDAKVLRFNLFTVALFQFLGKHSKKDKISFSFESIKRYELPNEFCFHIVVFCAGFLSQCLGGLSKNQVLLVLYFLQCSESTRSTFFHFSSCHTCPNFSQIFQLSNIPFVPNI